MTDTYEQRLAGRLNAMQNAWRQWLDGDSDSRETLVTHSHQLGGSAALYGYPELGEAANRLHAGIKQQITFSDINRCWQELQAMLVRIIGQHEPG